MKKSAIIKKFSDIIYGKYTSGSTLKTYSNLANIFVFDRHPDSINNLSSEYIKRYLLTIKEEKSISSYNQYMSVLKILYKDVLNQKYKVSKLYPIKQNRKLKNLPDILNIVNTLNKIPNKKHKAIIFTLYSTGIRMSELLNIKISDVESTKNRILISNGKGGKSRFVSLTTELLDELKTYSKLYKPKLYLFEGNNGKYSASSVNKVIKKYFGKENHAHIFRHVYITYMINKDVNIKRLKNMTGHKSDSSIEWYYQYTDNSIENIINPIHEYELVN